MSSSTTFFSAQLGDEDHARLQRHFIQLDVTDRHLRFGASLNDDAVTRYVESIDFERDEVYTIADDAHIILGAVHIAMAGPEAELGLSVVALARGVGIGNALFERAVMRLRNRCAREVLVRCLSQNAAMMHLARKHGMNIQFDGPDREARLELPPATSGTYLLEWLQDQQATYVGNLRARTRLGQSVLAAFPPLMAGRR